MPLYYFRTTSYFDLEVKEYKELDSLLWELGEMFSPRNFINSISQQSNTVHNQH